MFIGHEVVHALGRNVLPGIGSVILSAGVLCGWNMQRIGSAQTRVGGGVHRLSLVIGIMLAAVACMFIIARFITVD